MVSNLRHNNPWANYRANLQRTQTLPQSAYLFMFQGDAVVEHLDEVGGDLDAGHVDHDRVGGVTGLRGAGIVQRHHAKPSHGWMIK